MQASLKPCCCTIAATACAAWSTSLARKHRRMDTWRNSSTIMGWELVAANSILMKWMYGVSPKPTPCRKTIGLVNDSSCCDDSSADSCNRSGLESDPKGPDVGKRTQYDMPPMTACLKPIALRYMCIPTPHVSLIMCTSRGLWNTLRGSHKCAMNLRSGFLPSGNLTPHLLSTSFTNRSDDA